MRLELASRNLFWIMAILFILIRLFNIHEIIAQREIPIEADDAFSYIFHAKALDSLKPNQTKFFKSFQNLGEKREKNSWPEFYRKRFYHRIKRFYHLGHAVYLNLLHKITFSNYINTFWISIYLMGICIVIFPLLISRKVFGEKAAIFAGVIILFSYILQAHQMTGAPREWSNLLYFCLYFLWLLDIRDRWFGILFTLGIFPFISFHPIGPPLSYGFIIFALFALRFRKFRKRAIISLVSTSLAIGFYHGLFWFFEVTNYRLSYEIVVAPIFGLNGILQSYIPFFKSGVGIRDSIIEMFMVYPATIAIIYSLMKRNYLFAFIIIFIFGPHLGFYFVQFNYRPSTQYFPLKEYLNSTSIILNASLIGYFLFKYLPEKNKKYKTCVNKRCFIYALSLILVVLLQFSIYPKRFRNYFAKRHSFRDPMTFIERVDDIVPENECIVFSSEYMLYSYFTFTNKDRPVALVVNLNGNIQNYSTTDYRKCKYYALVEHDSLNKQRKPVLSMNSYLLLNGY